MHVRQAPDEKARGPKQAAARAIPEGRNWEEEQTECPAWPPGTHSAAVSRARQRYEGSGGRAFSRQNQCLPAPAATFLRGLREAMSRQRVTSTTCRGRLKVPT